MTTFHIDQTRYPLLRGQHMNRYLIMAHIALLIVIALMMLFY